MQYVFWIIALLLLLIDRGRVRAPGARSPYKAAAASLFLPGLGQIYNGQPRKGVALWVALVSVVLLAGIVGLDEHFWGSVFLVIISIALITLALFDAIRAAKSLQSYKLKTFNRWYIYVGAIIAAELVSMPARTAIGTRAFRIPTDAMLPTLEVGDFIMAKLETPESYQAKRGDVLIFKYPGDRRIDYIKRVAALPGETIEMRGGVLLIDGAAIHDSWASMAQQSDRQVSDFGRFTVPDGALFMLGDNLANSADSRAWGPLPRQNIVGVAKFVYFSWDPVAKNVRWSRIGLAVQGGE